MSMRKVLLCAIIALGSAATPVAAQITINLGTAPPAPRYEVAPAPRTGQVWAPGYWRWENERHVWAKGRWIKARSGSYWVADRWDPRDGRHYYVPGRWERGDHGKGNGKGKGWAKGHNGK